MAEITSDDIMDMLKKLLPGWLGGWIDSKLSGIMSILSAFGLGDKVEAEKNKLVNKVSESFAPNLVTARETVAANLDLNKVFLPFAKKAGLDDAGSQTLAGQLKALTSDATTAFLKDGIPPLDNGHPVDALRVAIKLRENIIIALAGGGADGKIGSLPIEDTERAATAQKIADMVVGPLVASADGSYDIATLLNKKPTQGIAAMLMDVQTKGNKKDYTLKSTDIALYIPEEKTIPPEVKKQAADAVANSKSNPGSDSAPPPPLKKKSPYQVS